MIKPRGCIGAVTDGRTITDEICRCGHSIEKHAGVGHGACWAGGGFRGRCHCLQYTWTRYVLRALPRPVRQKGGHS